MLGEVLLDKVVSQIRFKYVKLGEFQGKVGLRLGLVRSG